MKKKILVAALALVLVAVLCTSVIAAREESEVVQLFNCDTSFGSFAVDKNEKTEGTASLSKTLDGGGSFVAEKILGDEYDISDCDTIAFDMYISDVDQALAINNFLFEVSSAKKCDEQELQWDFIAQLRDDRLEEGWNTIYLDIGSATNTSFDPTAANYIRIYTTSYGNEAKGLVIKIDNVRACYTGGDDYSDLNLDFYKGENGDKDIIIQGQPEPDLSKRDEGITQSAGDMK